jgi:hypothetical protein
MPLLPTSAVSGQTNVDDDVPARRLIAVLAHVDAFVDVALHQFASSHVRRAGTGTRSRRPSLLVGSSPRRAAS